MGACFVKRDSRTSVRETINISSSNQRHWKRPNPSQQPPPRYAASMAYDDRQGLSLLFGGGALNDTWVWNGVTWSEQTPQYSPPARTSACMAYHAASQRIVLFGGVDASGTPLNDTWTWNGSDWQEQHPQTRPAGRSGAALACDVQHQRLVLFGGQVLNGRVGKLQDDTWTWDGSDWQANTVATRPEARLGTSLAYDVGQERVLLFGGTNGQQTFDDTWAWDGQAWASQKVTGQLPPARAWANLAYDSSANLLVLTSGSNNATPQLGDSWTWNGLLWKQIPTNGLPAGPYQSMTYDAAREALVVYAVSGSKISGNTSNHRLFQASGIRPQLSSQTWVWTL